jgi:hypothetical protein
MKLLIIKALDNSTRMHDGLDWLLGRHHLQIQTGTGMINEPGDDNHKTGYQRLLSIMMEKKVGGNDSHQGIDMIILLSSGCSLCCSSVSIYEESALLPDPESIGGCCSDVSLLFSIVLTL